MDQRLGAYPCGLYTIADYVAASQCCIIMFSSNIVEMKQNFELGV